MSGPVLLHSALLAEVGVPHAFTTRLGGLSPAPFDSLNFGNPGDLPAERRDPPDRIAANWALALGAIGCAGHELVEVHQVHGRGVHTVARGAPTHPGLPAGTSTKADAIVTDDAQRVAAVRVADCAPVLLASADGRVVAAIHAGWRGVVANIAGAAVDALRSLHGAGARDPAIVAAIGPCIGPEALEVGPEVAAEFDRAFGRDAGRASGLPRFIRSAPAPGKFYADMPAALEHQLRECGVSRVDVIRACTASEPERFFSHRREKGITGRQAGIIAPRA